MNTLALDDRRKDSVVEELKRESGGSFSVVYRALRTVSQNTGSVSTTLKKSDVLSEIRRLRKTEKQHTK
jgi:hypothetical protein